MSAPAESLTPLAESMALEAQAASLRGARDRLRDVANAIQQDIEAIKRAHLPALRDALAACAQAETDLRQAVEASPAELWRRTRTRLVHGIRIGWIKSRGKVEWDDEAKVIERIRRLLPAEQAALLIRVREAVHKPAVYDLTAGDLKRLGIRIEDDCDVVVVKDVAGELDRMLERLLADLTEEGAA